MDIQTPEQPKAQNPPVILPTFDAPVKRPSKVCRKSTHKTPMIQAAVVAKRAMGLSRKAIAKDLGIAPNTVTSIVNLSQVDTVIANCDEYKLGLIPKAFKAIELRLAKGDGLLGLQYLKWVLGDTPLAKSSDDSLKMAFQNCQVVIQQAVSKLAEVMPTQPESAPDSQRIGNASEALTAKPVESST